MSGIAAAFILVNSAAGLFGVLSVSMQLPEELPLLVAAAVIGGFIGSEVGSKHLGYPESPRCRIGNSRCQDGVCHLVM